LYCNRRRPKNQNNFGANRPVRVRGNEEQVQPYIYEWEQEVTRSMANRKIKQVLVVLINNEQYFLFILTFLSILKIHSFIKC
jgi:hypothetical protein